MRKRRQDRSEKKPKARKALPGARGPTAKATDLEREPLYRAKGLGRSKDGRSAADHDEILYGIRRR